MNEPVRVMLLLSSLHGGGAERVAVHLLNRCDKALIDVRMGLLRKAGPFLEDADDHSRIHVSPVGQDFLAFEGHNSSFYRPQRLIAGAVLAPANVSSMIRAHRPQVVMSFLKGMSVLTYFVLKGLGAQRPKWIAREGNNTDAVIDDEIANPAGRALIKTLTRRCYRAADCFLANSHEMANGLRHALDLDPSRVRVIHNPIDLSEVQRRSREPLPTSQQRPFIVTAGRLEYQKGHDVLLRAFAASPAAREFDLVILGRGTLEADLRRQAAELGVGERVRFLGFTPNPWAWFARARLFVLSSRWEGFPSVVAEAMACGAPALVTACDYGPAEVVQHGRSGIVVPPEDALAFAEAMDGLLRDPENAARLAAAGTHRARSFGIGEMVDAYSRLFVEQAQPTALAALGG
ncbi:MAG TPA: glycosyltransferase [Caulobacteraceae bacterium]|nr:glycosyltransferase [Caulobacteraceae bacterium]